MEGGSGLEKEIAVSSCLQENHFYHFHVCRSNWETKISKFNLLTQVPTHVTKTFTSNEIVLGLGTIILKTYF